MSDVGRQGIYEIDWDAENEIVPAERLPNLYRRWLEFLVDGYDTIGECWGWGTHVHGWSCAPTRDLVFYTLGVTPAEPGYAVARIAPRPGRLAWATGDVPTPHGLLHVEARGDAVTIDTPVPAIVELPGQAPRALSAGRHTVAAS